jgi:hypothetical protein
MELYFKSQILKSTLTPKCDISRFFSSMNLLRGISNCERLSYLLFKYLTRPSQELKDKLAKIVVDMKLKEKLMLENWQFSVMEFKSEFSLCSNENQALVSVDEMIAPNIWPSIVGKSLAESYLLNIPFNQAFAKRISHALSIGNNPQFQSGEYDPKELLRIIPKFLLKSPSKVLIPKLSISKDIYQAVYFYRNCSIDDSVLSINIMKSLLPKDPQSDRIAKFLRNLPILYDFKDFEQFYPILQDAYFHENVQNDDALFLFNSLKNNFQLITCLKGLTEGKFFSSGLDKITTPDEMLVLLYALRFC